ncbi:MAG: hypothetical protein AAGD11_14885 [Planctomycetota bacterium]
MIMDTPRWLLLLSIALMGLIAFAAFSYDTPRAIPDAHPKFAAMEIGGQRARDDVEHWHLGLGLGLVMIAYFTAFLTLAAGHTSHGTSLRIATLAGAGLFAGAFALMMHASREYAVLSENPTTLGPFPAPTTYLCAGVWLTPLVFTAIYCFGFNLWFAAEDDGNLVTTQSAEGAIN